MKTKTVTKLPDKGRKLSPEAKGGSLFGTGWLVPTEQEFMS
ncbi:hypothetical protein [Rhizobacter sp. P5_C2]|jgi:hypothetical protein